MFNPQIYNSLVALREASILGAHSNTTIDNIDVFGFLKVMLTLVSMSTMKLLKKTLPMQVIALMQ